LQTQESVNLTNSVTKTEQDTPEVPPLTTTILPRSFSTPNPTPTWKKRYETTLLRKNLHPSLRSRRQSQCLKHMSYVTPPLWANGSGLLCATVLSKSRTLDQLRQRPHELQHLRFEPQHCRRQLH